MKNTFIVGQMHVESGQERKRNFPLRHTDALSAQLVVYAMSLIVQLAGELGRPVRLSIPNTSHRPLGRARHLE